MQLLLRSLNSLQLDLHSALSLKDWSTVAALDSKCRMLLEEVVALTAALAPFFALSLSGQLCSMFHCSTLC